MNHERALVLSSHHLAWSRNSRHGALSMCREDEDLGCQAEDPFWQRWQLATDPEPNTWELVTPLALPFVP